MIVEGKFRAADCVLGMGRLNSRGGYSICNPAAVVERVTRWCRGGGRGGGDFGDDGIMNESGREEVWQDKVYVGSSICTGLTYD